MLPTLGGHFFWIPCADIVRVASFDTLVISNKFHHLGTTDLLSSDSLTLADFVRGGDGVLQWLGGIDEVSLERESFRFALGGSLFGIRIYCFVRFLG